jgi:hypothetical protein
MSRCSQGPCGVDQATYFWAVCQESCQAMRLPPLTKSPWRDRLTYGAMSLVVGWHSLAMIIAPMPDDSELVQTFRFILQPYLSLFRLDNKWNFFAPSVGRHLQFRYVVEDSKGGQHVFIPVLEPRESVAHYVMWRELKYFYEGVMEAPDIRGYAIVPLSCQRHASLNPVAITLQQVQEGAFSPDDYLRGHRPQDPEFMTVNTLSKIDC